MATYTVQKDDTLSKIASKVKRSKRSLHAANHGVIGSNPDNVTPGMVLTIPANGSEEDDDDGA